MDDNKTHRVIVIIGFIREKSIIINNNFLCEYENKEKKKEKKFEWEIFFNVENIFSVWKRISRMSFFKRFSLFSVFNSEFIRDFVMTSSNGFWHVFRELLDPSSKYNKNGITRIWVSGQTLHFTLLSCLSVVTTEPGTFFVLRVASRRVGLKWVSLCMPIFIAIYSEPFPEAFILLQIEEWKFLVR